MYLLLETVACPCEFVESAIEVICHVGPWSPHGLLSVGKSSSMVGCPVAGMDWVVNIDGRSARLGVKKTPVTGGRRI